MRAVQIESFGGPEVLRMVEVPAPEPGPDDLLVEVRAASVNRADLLTRRGAYHRGARLPLVLGREGSGVVRAVGSAVRGFEPGDRVLALTGRPGWYAERVAAPAALAVRVPGGVAWDAAAALPTAGLSAWYGLRHLARVREGETALIHAAASGVGDAAVQIVRHLGARAIAAAGSDEKVAWALANGADWGVNVERQDVAAEVAAITGGRGVDVVLDAVGGRAFASSLKAVGHGGRVVALANVTLEDSVINTRDFYPKNATIYGFQIDNLRERGYDPRPDLEALLGLLAEGRLRVHVDRTFPLDEAAEAHRYLEARRNRGKVMLTLGG